MKSILIAFVCLVTSFKVFGQLKISPKYSIGLAHRIEPITLKNKNYNKNIYGFEYEVIGNCTNLTFDIFDTVKINKLPLIVSVSNYFSYTYFRTNRDILTGQNTDTENRFKHDHFIEIHIPIKTKKTNTSFLFGIGFGVMNVGTGFKYDYITGLVDSTGSPIINKETKANFAFVSPKITGGIGYKKLAFLLSIYSTPERLNSKLLTIWIESKINFYLSNKKK